MTLSTDGGQRGYMTPETLAESSSNVRQTRANGGDNPNTSSTA